MILFRTIHGSRLYNLANKDSDEDYYTVIVNRPKRRSRYIKQTITNGIDSVVLDLSTFVMYCDLGVPQALEAMFSQQAEIDIIREFRSSYRPNAANMLDRYHRTIRSFANGDAKGRRHALRMSLNLTEFMESGRFNPTLSDEDARLITDLTLDGSFPA